MWRLFVFVVIIPWAACQNGRDNHDHHGHGWDIRLAVPGEPGSDYPTLGAIPRTSFSCAGREPGYYADYETNCQVFRICTIGATYGFQSFLCPNGTLFNQGVFVCDWWMNVKCEKSEPLLNNNGDRFSNLRLGPQLMKDIKKMLTHPMRNPYDLTSMRLSSMRGNLIVMQDYKPPAGQLFPNEALIGGPERIPNNVYVPAKQILPPQNFNDNNDLSFAASTPEPRYLPAAYNTIQPSTQNAEFFQRQNTQFGQYNRPQNIQTQQRANLISNSHAGRIAQSANLATSNQLIASQPTQPTRPTQNYNQVNFQFAQKQKINPAPTPNTQSIINTNGGQFNGQNSRYTDNSQRFSQLNNKKQSELALARQQNVFNTNQEKQAYIYNPPAPQYLNEINGKLEAKQNLVSTNQAPKPTIIAKTLTFSKLVDDPKPGKPKSRITVKTWIVKPSKSGKLLSPTPYTYNRPTRTPRDEFTDSTPYVYNRPTTYSQTERFVTESNEPYVYNRPVVVAKQIVTTSGPYVYDKPTAAAKQIVSTDGPYVYNRPTAAAKQIITTNKPLPSYAPPTAPRPTFSGRQYLAPNIAAPPPTKASLIYLPPTTFKPAARIYLPPAENQTPRSSLLARQYLPPESVQPTYFPGEQLRQAPTTPTTTFTSPSITTTTTPSYSFAQQSHVNTNHNNLTFTDILTKENLDITVNNIVKDTSKVLNTASPAQFGQLKQDFSAIDYPDDKYLPPEQAITDSGESLTSQTPVVSKSSKLILAPSKDLEPPIETQKNHHISNQLSNLPFFKEPTNTIERTVSLKISIPEKVADYLFKRNNDTDFNRLEILNTGSSNYLVLTNNNFVKPTSTSLIPIGKLIENKNSNISNSQALVFSILADSINVAKEYSNLANQDTTSSTPALNQYRDHEDVSPITHQISQLTSSQFGNNNLNANTIAPTKSTIIENELTENVGNNLLKQDLTSQQQPTSPSLQMQIQSERYRNAVLDENTGYPYPINYQNVYSGQLYQLPVPVVTNQIYNKDNSARLILSDNSQNTNSNANYNSNSNAVKPTPTVVENINSETLSPARLQLSSNNQGNSNDINDFLRNDNGISAQIQDKITGTITHPLERNKFINYKKDQTYYIYTKFNDGNENVITNQPVQQRLPQNAKLIQTTNTPKVVAFQFIPSVSYQLEDEKDQQKILNAFQIDQFGSPKQISGKLQDQSQGREILTSDVNYTVDHTPSEQSKAQYNDISTLYNGPSSYSAPQASIGNLRLAQVNNYNAKLELEDNRIGYSRVVPSRQFNF